MPGSPSRRSLTLRSRWEYGEGSLLHPVTLPVGRSSVRGNCYSRAPVGLPVGEFGGNCRKQLLPRSPDHPRG